MHISSLSALLARHSLSDILAQVHRCEQETWPAPMQASSEALLRRARTNPEGFWIGYEEGPLRVGGFLTSITLDYDCRRYPSWFKATDYGSLSTHDPDAGDVYIVNISVSPRSQGQGVGSRLLSALKRHAPEHARRVVVVPRLEKAFASLPSVADLEADRKLKFYGRNGFAIDTVYTETDVELQGPQVGVVMSAPSTAKVRGEHPISRLASAESAAARY